MIPTNTTVALERRDDSAVDGYGNPRPTWATVDVYAVWLEQTSAQEVTEGTDTALSDWLLVVPGLVDLDYRDRVREGDRVFEVVGAPDTKRVPGGAPHHVEARLRMVTGDT